jgi:hypothetical protein
VSESINWTAIDGPERYEAAALNRPTLLPQVRRELKRDFETLITKSREATMSAVLEPMSASPAQLVTVAERDAIVAKIEETWERWIGDGDLGEFQRNRYRAAGLRALAQVGKPSDAVFARQFCESSDRHVARACLEIFARFGTPQDVTRLVAMAGRLYAEDARRAAELSVGLAHKKSKVKVLRQLREHVSLKEWCVTQLGHVDGGLDEAWVLLRDSDHTIRITAARIIWDALPRDQRDGCLSYYMTGWHYFDVVRWFDCRLYSPDWLRSALPRAPS